MKWGGAGGGSRDGTLRGGGKGRKEGDGNSSCTEEPGFEKSPRPSCKIRKHSMENESRGCSSSSGRGIASEFHRSPWEGEQRKQEMAIVEKVSFFKTPRVYWAPSPTGN